MNPPTDQQERRARRIWVSLILLLLGIQVCIGGVAIYLATSDSSVAIVPDYHNVALDWDSKQRSRTAAERLGWKTTLTASDVADLRGMRAVELSIQDRNDDPVDNLSIAGTVYHHAAANRRSPVQFKSTGQGRYLSMMPMSQPGLWELELQTEDSSDPISIVTTLTIQDTP